MNFLRKTFGLCSAFSSYQAVLDLPVTASLRFLALIVTICTVALTLSWLPRAVSFAHESVNWLVQRAPAMTLTDGKLSSPVEQPFRARQDDFLFVLDTAGSTAAPVTNALRGVLLTTDKLTAWVSSRDGAFATVTRETDLRHFPSGRINREYLERLFQSWVVTLVPVALVGLTFVGFTLALAHAFLFAWAASFLERGNPTPLTFRQLLNLAIHAVTPAAILVTVYLACDLRGMDYWLVYLVVYGIFLIGSSNTCRRLLYGEQPQEDEMS